MKFFIYLSLTILILAPFSSITCRRSSNKSKRRRNAPLQVQPQAPAVTQGTTATSSSSSSAAQIQTLPSNPTINIERPYSNSQPMNFARPVPTVVSRPPFLSGPPQGPRIVRSGFVSSPVMAVRRFAVVRSSLNQCPEDFHSNMLVKEIAEFCPRVCSKRYCIQINEICCIYRDYRDFHHNSHAVVTRIMRRK